MFSIKPGWLLGMLFVALLSGCGGGSGGGTGSGLSVSPTTLNFAAEYSASAPPAQYIDVTISNTNAVAIVAGYAAGTVVPSWMSLSLLGSGANWQVKATITSTSLTPGTYHATVRIGIVNSSSALIAYRDVQVTYVVSVHLGVSSSSLNFSYAIGSPSGPANQLVNITGAGINWTASADQAWVTLGTSSGIAPGSMAIIVDPTGLAAGTYNATVTISDTGSSDTATVNVMLTVSSPAFSLSSASLTFNGVSGGTVAPQNVSIAVNNGDTVSWTAVPGSAWLSATPSGTTPGTVVVGVDSSVGPLAAGTYNSTVSLSGTSGGQPLNTTINVQFTVTDPVFTVNQSTFTFSGINGATLSAQTLNIAVDNGDNISWTAVAADGWLKLGKTSGTTTPDTLGISVDPSVGPLTAGSYSSTVTLTGTSNGVAMNKVVNVNLSLAKPTINITQSSILLGGSDGTSTSTQPLDFSINTGGNAYPWTLTLDDGSGSWLIADSTSGTVSSTGATANLDANRSTVSGGSYAGTATVSVTVNGDVVTSSAIPVTLNVAAHKLFIADDGVALASMPTVSRLSQTLQVEENLGGAVSWSASSDQAWLSVTSSGTTPGNLTLTADPTGLTADTLYLATVTVSSSNPVIENTQTVRVGFWVGSSDPNATDSVSASFTEAVADPIRPYVYVNNGGTDITVYNVHTATVVTTISTVASTLGDMVTSSDGSTLWAVDTTNFEIVPVDLDTFSVGTAWSSTSLASATRLGYARPGGHGMVLVGANGRLHDAGTGAELSQTFVPTSGELAVSRASNLLCGLGWCSDLGYDELGNAATVGASKTASAGSNCHDVAVNADGTRAYFACGSPYQFSVFDTTTASPMTQLTPLTGGAYPGNIEIGSNDLIFGGRYPYSSTPDIWVYNSAGVEQATYDLTSWIYDRQLVVSGDSLRMIVLTGAYSTTPYVEFVTVGP